MITLPRTYLRVALTQTVTHDISRGLPTHIWLANELKMAVWTLFLYLLMLNKFCPTRNRSGFSTTSVHRYATIWSIWNTNISIQEPAMYCKPVLSISYIITPWNLKNTATVMWHFHMVLFLHLRQNCTIVLRRWNIRNKTASDKFGAITHT